MATIPHPFLFRWDSVDQLGDLERLKLVLDVLPDEPLMQLLEAGRGRGRNDYPVRPMWNSLIAGSVFQHRRLAARVAAQRAFTRLQDFYDQRGAVERVNSGWLAASGLSDRASAGWRRCSCASAWR